MIMKPNILHNIISLHKNFITRCIALAMVAMVGVGNAWADPIQLSDLVFSTSNTKRIVNEDFSGCSTTNQTATKSANSNLSGFGIFTKIMNGNTSNHYIIESSTFSSNAVKLTNGSNNMLILSTASLSFGSTGAFRFKTSSAAKNMVIGLYSTNQAATEYYAKARASVYIKNHQGAISISNNASTNWQSVGSAEGIIDICVIYNNTNSGTTYGNSISLGSKKAHVYINGNCAMNNDDTPKAFSIPGTSLDYFRLSCTNSSGNSAYVDDIQIWNELPSYDNSCAAPTAVASSSPTNTGTTLTVTDANNVNKYDFCCNTSSSASKSVTASVSGGKSKAITGLNYGTKYYYWARTDCGSSSYSTWYPSSDPSYFTTTCPNPTSISAGSPTKTGVTFTIVDENSPALSTYGIYYSTNSTAPTSGTSATTTSTSTSKSVTGLTAGTKYYYWVRGQGPDANSTTWVSGGNFTTLHEYTLTYKETDGTGNGSGKVDENATSFTNTSAPSKDGYRLEGFYTSSGLSTKVASNARAFVPNIDGWTGAGGAYTKGSNADLYLKWDANTYTVTFDKNGGGTGTGTADQDFTYGVAQNLRACGFTAPTDKYFLGWNTNKNATTALYTDGESVSNLTTTHEGTVTLYAIWKDYSFTNYRTSCCTPWDDPTWSYDTYSLSTGGSGATKTLSGTTHGTLSFASSNVSVISVNPSTGAVSPVGAGTAYVIATWESDGTYCEKVMNSSTFTVTGTVTVTFKKNGGTGTDDQTQSITYNTATNLKTISTLGLTAPSCKYFYGWATSQSDADAGTRTYTDGQSVTLEEGVTLYAIWKTTQYTISDGTLSGVDSHSYSATSIDCGTTLTITCAADASHKGNPTVTATGTHGTIEVVSATSVTIANVQSDMAVSISYAAKENYAITWKVAGSALTGAAIASCTNNVLEGESITALPSAPANNTLAACSANKFMGWAKLNADIVTPMTDADDIAALGLFTTAAGAPEITENTTFYAVFANSTSGTWNMGTITTIEKGATMSYANCNGSHTVTGSDGNDYSYTSYQIMNSSGNQFQSGAGYMYNTTPFPAMTQIFIDGGSNKTGYLSVYESDSEIGSNPGTLVALTGTPSDSYWDYTYTLSGKSYFLLKAGSETIKANEITITFGSATNYVTKCCTPLDEINGDKTSLVYNGVTLTWDDIDNVDSWEVTGVDGADNVVPAGNIGTPSSDGTTYTCAISNLSQYTDYVFTISATAASGYCDKAVDVEVKTPCVAPSSLSIAATGSKWDYCAGESMTLTVSGTNISTSATYQWQKHNGSTWVDIDGAESASYAVASMAASNAGQYRCTVTNPGSSCDATTSGVWVRLWQLYINNGTADAWQSLDFSNTNTGTGSNTTVFLTSDKGYKFKLKDNTGGYFGLNSKTVTTTESNITLNGTGDDVNVTSGLEGNYTFAIDYASSGTKDNPKISITYPVANQANNRNIWFDKSVITGWTDAGTSDIFYRIGTSTGHTNNTKTGGTAWTLVPGTDRFYTTKTMAFNGFEVWQIANNIAWCDDSDDSHDIYVVKPNSPSTTDYDITRSIVHQKYVVGEGGVTLVPTTKKNTDSYGCDYWYVTKTDGMLKHTATITAYSHGTVTVAYTKYDGTGAANFTSGSNDDLAHRCILTITAVADAGYQLTSLQVNSSDIDSGDEHILDDDATITAVFTAQTSTVTLKPNGGSGSDQTVTATYDASMPGTLSGGGDIVKPSRDNYSFTGYFDNTSGGTQYYTSTLTSAKIWDKTGAQNLYAQWQGDSYTITFKDKGDNAYSGSNGGSLPTSHTYGAATALVDGVKTGYHFDGWYTDASCTAGNEVTSIDATAITASTTYYAKWTIENYDVTWMVNGENYTTGDPSGNADYNTQVSTLPTAPSAPEGCSDKVFKGWSTSNLGKTTGQSAPADLFTTAEGSPTIMTNTTFYAVWADETPESSTTTWTKTSNTSDLQTGTYAILTHQLKAFTGGISSGHGQVTDDAFSFTDNVATSAPDGMLEVTITRVAANQFRISRVVNIEDVPTTQYLHATKCGSGGLAWSTETGSNYWFNNSGKGIRYSVQYKYSNVDTYPYIQSTTNDPPLRTSGVDGSNYMWFAKKGSVVTPASYSNYVTECDAPAECGTPTFSVDEDTYTETQSVTISTTTPGATIRYTTDGTDPTSSSGTVYSEPVEVSCTTTLKAIAYKDGREDSEVGSATITIKVPDPTFSVNSGTYYAVQNVTLSCDMDGATIYYETTNDGTDPTTPTSSSTEYTGAINIPANSTIKVSAIAIKDGCATASDVVTKTYVVRIGTNYTLVTDVNNMYEGDKVVIVADNGSTRNAVNTYAAGNDRPSTNDFDFANNERTVVTVYPLKVGDTYTVQVFELQGGPGAWVFKAVTDDTKKYLGLKDDNNYLKTYTADDDDQTKWTIAISTGIARITNKQRTTRYIEYNSSGSKFACYTSNQTARTKLYSVPTTDPVIKVEASLSAFTSCAGNAGTYQSFYVSGKNLTGNMVISGPTGYEFCSTSGGTYTSTLELSPSTGAVARQLVYVRLAASATSGAHNGNINVAVSANSLSKDVAITGSATTSDAFVDMLHSNATTYQCGSYDAPDLSDETEETSGTCAEVHYKFMGWVAESDLTSLTSDGAYKSVLVKAGDNMTADGTTYYAVWGELE